jgi:hypothetical protein
MRQVEIVTSGEPFIEAEPGDYGKVRVGAPEKLDGQSMARYAIGAMAYALMDGVARESIRGAAWARADRRGRPVRVAGSPKSNKERQRTFRARQGASTPSRG